MSFLAARMLSPVILSSSSVSQQMKAMLCGASCLITALEGARMWQSSSSINITWQARRHQFVKCKSLQCSSMSPSLFCQVPCSKWVPIHILFSSFSHLSCFLRDCELRNTLFTQFTYSPWMRRSAFSFFALGMCAMSPKWLWQVFRFHYFYLLNQQNSLLVPHNATSKRTNHVTVSMATELFCRAPLRPHTNKPMLT